MNYTITSDDAKKIILSRLIYIIPCAVIGVTVAFITQKVRLEMLMVALPIVAVLIAASVFVGLQIGKKKLVATRFIIDNDAFVEMKNGNPVKQLFFAEQLTVKENMIGLIIKGPRDFIAIPKQLSCYNEMKAELEGRIVS